MHNFVRVWISSWIYRCTHVEFHEIFQIALDSKTESFRNCRRCGANCECMKISCKLLLSLKAQRAIKVDNEKLKKLFRSFGRKLIAERLQSRVKFEFESNVHYTLWNHQLNTHFKACTTQLFCSFQMGNNKQ